MKLIATSDLLSLGPASGEWGMCVSPDYLANQLENVFI